jgi:hypothetical protein
LQAAWKIPNQFVLDVGAIDHKERVQLDERCTRALDFLASNCLGVWSHVANRDGKPPKEASIWGWKNPTGRKWIPLGTRIGWLSGTEIFLDPKASYHAAEALSGTERFSESEQALRHRFRERGLLASVDRGRGMVQVRRTLEGAARLVLHLKARDLLGSKISR